MALRANNPRHAHSTKCGLCGEYVDLDRAIPAPCGELCHKDCWAKYTGALDWFRDAVRAYKDSIVYRSHPAPSGGLVRTDRVNRMCCSPQSSG